MTDRVWLVHEVRDYGADTVWVFGTKEAADALVATDPGMKSETPYLSKYDEPYEAVVE